ncbi:uncharacterized protein TRIVIDRAFT_68859 [Trichoderma virens Gv29-8]|uniref:Uncharacterized protein n=1 Tax=Hypocrea virens (strain Gv29-8 / FGSC 10586) TaxID=413071 RepID=G9MZ22_HYPVG|nr:uncharacterized protein TRIVIDRAFT_68859 [Trichoderma virens Gv29-8]EHK20350.1 hypothetical protein TRIVIDRAFT_68859 [Trichoderma virens Gv29-8]UKZ47010.1 hypothetical protein TrVGV298_001221 [Trichoderma virens]
MAPSSKQHWLPVICRQVQGTDARRPMPGKYLPVQAGQAEIASANLEKPSPRTTFLASKVAKKNSSARRGGTQADGKSCLDLPFTYRPSQVQAPVLHAASAGDKSSQSNAASYDQSRYRYLYSLLTAPCDAKLVLATGDDGAAAMGVQRTGAWRGVCPFSAPSTLGNTTPTTQEGPDNGLWLGEQSFGPSTLGGWCAGSVLRELPAGTPVFDSRQSAPSPSGPSSGGRALRQTDGTPPRWTGCIHPDTYSSALQHVLRL